MWLMNSYGKSFSQILHTGWIIDLTNSRYPDFKHQKTQDALWIDGRSTPDWVKVKLAALKPDAVQQSVFSWTSAIARDVKSGHYSKALENFQQMQSQGAKADKFTFVWVLKACTCLSALEKGRQVHALIVQWGYESDVIVGSCLVDMYAKCGSIDDAFEVFNKMAARDVFSWSAIITGFAKCGKGQKALQLFRQMQQEVVNPDNVTFVGVLKACTSMIALEEGRHVHAKFIQGGYESDVVVGSSLVDMYAKCGSIDDACRVFNSMLVHDVFSWSVLILGYAKCGQAEKALQLFRQMQREGVKPDTVTFVGVLNACASGGTLEEGRWAHTQIVQSGFQLDVFVGSSLVDMYAKCGSIEDAWKVFKGMPTRNVYSWNAIIGGYVKCREYNKAMELFKQMQHEGMEPDIVTLVSVLNACCNLGALEEGRSAHAKAIKKGYGDDATVGSCLIDMYAECGSIEDSLTVFNSKLNHNVVSWSAMLDRYMKMGQLEKAWALFQQMEREGVQPDSFTFVSALNACASLLALKEGRHVHLQVIHYGLESDVFVGSCLVSMYAKCECIEDAQKVFNNMPVRDIFAWNAMLGAYVKFYEWDKVLTLYQQMEQVELKPDIVTFVHVLNACANLAVIQEGMNVHAQVLKRNFESNPFVGSCLVDMYAKCGALQDACRVFNNMTERDVFSWNAMLGGYAMHGLGTKAVWLFELMCQEGVIMDRATLVCLLSACSHAGILNEGLYYFESMNPIYGLCPEMEHYSCMVDLLGRSALLSEAEDIIKMSSQPQVSLWMALLAACKLHGNVQLGERVAKCIFELDPESAPGYVLLSNTYATAGESDTKANIQNIRKERRVYKQPGCTWIQLDSQMHTFVVDDKEHPRMMEIRAQLKELSEHMKKEGYPPEAQLLLHESKTEVLLRGHSEMLAIAFGLISTPPDTPLHIFKNLRVCSHCHTATKFITKLVGRTMVVRDANRFHHFKNGVCSCGDYW
ncbi:hypothetical protein O6H91_09G020300 [Diphasiastrum complanatum]|uniref:Uncharacterized protein n=1 Tax=Diphasiastrum complanatum TaxID=34168 RepID=A0ACC2CLV2_DIPCM|nr:hypothetical protein O6H91_09G020300 [Diphasiastrum complanatum]